MKQNKKLEVKNSSINGRGIFAKCDLKKDSFIGYIKGPFVRLDKSELKEKSMLLDPNFVGVAEGVWINPELPFLAINHSCNPNSGIKGKRSVFAMRDIKKGEEVTFDYSTSEVDLLWELDYKCNCGYKNCRITIKSIQSLPKPTINKYMPYIPSLIKKFYDDNK